MSEPYPICVLAGNYKQYCDYIKEQGATNPLDKRWVDGMSANCLGIHFQSIIEIGTFRSDIGKATELRAIRQASVCSHHKTKMGAEGGVIVFWCDTCGAKAAKPVDPWKGAKADEDDEFMTKVKYASIPEGKPMPMSAHSPQMSPGEIRKLPKGSSPLFTEQWAYQGTAKAPYIITARRKPGDGVKTGWDYTWACSCRNWTTTMPRQDCKHCIAIKLKEKILVTAVQGASSLDPGMQKEFEKFLAQKQTDVVGLKKSNALQEKGRRFRT